jgi:hypothetical protein
MSVARRLRLGINLLLRSSVVKVRNLNILQDGEFGETEGGGSARVVEEFRQIPAQENMSAEIEPFLPHHRHSPSVINVS